MTERRDGRVGRGDPGVRSATAGIPAPPRAAPVHPTDRTGEFPCQAGKGFSLGTDRVRPPSETLALVGPHLTALGITRIANVTGLDRIGIPVVTVCRPNTRSVAVAQGKGLTLDAAKASGVMEAIEGYHAEHIVRPVLIGTFEELAPSNEMATLDLLPRLRSAGSPAREKRLWIEGTNLMGRAPTLLPYEVVTTDYTVPLPLGAGTFVMSSNGLASGNHHLEAISHGLCEVIERDATTFWFCATPEERARRRLDLSTVDDPSSTELLQRFDAAEVEVMVWDTTTDVGVASFRCTISDRVGCSFTPAPVVSAAGCHPRREIALVRALTEAAQGRLTLISGSRDDLHQRWFDEEVARREVKDFATLWRAPASRAFQEVPSVANPTFDADVAHEVEALAACGFRQVLVVDLTRPEILIPVVRVVVPGLEPMHDAPGFAPGPRARSWLGEGRR
jgi:YcaO-like protein with predicted kinase domain